MLVLIKKLRWKIINAIIPLNLQIQKKNDRNEKCTAPTQFKTKINSNIKTK